RCCVQLRTNRERRTSHMSPLPRLTFAISVILLLVTHSVNAAPDGCTSIDFKVAPRFDATLNIGFPLPSYAVADLDGDGKLDLVVTDNTASGVVTDNTNGVAVLLNDGTGQFG